MLFPFTDSVKKFFYLNFKETLGSLVWDRCGRKQRALTYREYGGKAFMQVSKNFVLKIWTSPWITWGMLFTIVQYVDNELSSWIFIISSWIDCSCGDAVALIVECAGSIDSEGRCLFNLHFGLTATGDACDSLSWEVGHPGWFNRFSS